jgi:farnesyl diphosphate synthase
LYAVSGGKCIRAFLVSESARIYGVSEYQALRVGAAVEAIHAYSLIHDDLPCMDNDNFRRGKPTVHIKWDESVAVLIGDALQSLSFEILSEDKTSSDPSVRLALISSLSKAIGAKGMVYGQFLDMEAERQETLLDIDAVKELQNRKTGALIEWAALTGPLMAGVDNTPLKKYAQLLGLAFQIQDDILDVEGEIKMVGKRLRKDYLAGKATFVSCLGLSGAKKKAESLINQAVAELDTFDTSSDNLKALAQFVISREV